VDKQSIEHAVEDLSTIDDFIRWSVSQFNTHNLFFGHGTNDSWDEAVALVFSALHLPFEASEYVRHTKLVRSEREYIADLVHRRVNERIPVPYLVNRAWFCHLEFFVDERVLIPRSPIGEMIEQEFLPWIDSGSVHRVLDLCTGSGCIAIACSYAFPDAEIDAVDISTDALDVAQVNIEQLDCMEKVFPIQSDVFDQIPEGVRYDVIVSNPPYVDSQDFEQMPVEFTHEPELALVSGRDGLHLTKRILAQAADYLNDEGILIVEVGDSMLQLVNQYPEVDFNWVEFKRGGDGVFVLTKAQLIKYKTCFDITI
tara:strand:+ start:4942 stop:5877 length:936 start_codon:yes stop_codon:yes gene_type:complete